MNTTTKWHNALQRKNWNSLLGPVFEEKIGAIAMALALVMVKLAVKGSFTMKKNKTNMEY